MQMFLTDKQSIILTAVITACFFISGILGILDNYMVIIVILIGFLALVLNLIMALMNKKNPE